MGGDWHNSDTFYGYSISVPKDMTYREFICKLDQMNRLHIIPESKGMFKVTALLESTYSEDYDMISNEENDDMADIIIAIDVQRDLQKMLNESIQLKEYIKNNPLLQEFTIGNEPDFYSGIDWFESICNISYEDYPQYNETRTKEDGVLASEELTNKIKNELNELRKKKKNGGHFTYNGKQYNVSGNKIENCDILGSNCAKAAFILDGLLYITPKYTTALQ